MMLRSFTGVNEPATLSYTHLNENGMHFGCGGDFNMFRMIKAILQPVTMWIEDNKGSGSRRKG